MQEQEQNLCREIIEDAQRKARRIIDRAKRDAKKLLDEVEAENAKMRTERLAKADREGEGKARAILASIGQEKRRQWLVRRESVLNDVFDAAIQQLEGCDGRQRRHMLLQLTEEALRAFSTCKVRICLASDDKQWVTTNSLAEVVKHVHPGATAVEDLEVSCSATDTGVVVETLDGKQRLDNTLHARLKRFHNDLRNETAAILSAMSNNKDAHESEG